MNRYLINFLRHSKREWVTTTIEAESLEEALSKISRRFRGAQLIAGVEIHASRDKAENEAAWYNRVAL